MTCFTILACNQHGSKSPKLSATFQMLAVIACVLLWENCFLKCRKSIYTVAIGNTTLYMQPYTDGHADKHEVTSSWGVTGGMCAGLR